MVRRVFRWGIPLTMLGFLAYALGTLGWGKIIQDRPGSLYFYLIVLVPYFVQPIADLFLYRHLFKIGSQLPLLVMLRKRYMNNLMFEYSGEMYFFLWARKNLPLPKGRLMHAVKDSNVLSASAALAVVLAMLVAMVTSGAVRLPGLVQSHPGMAFFIAALPLVLGIGLFVGGRRVTSLSRLDVATVFGVHFGRSALQLALELTIWLASNALPSTVACLQFVVLRLLVNRLPLVPNKDLVFIGVGLAAAGMMDVSSPKVAAVLVLITASGLLQDLLLVGLPWFFEQFQLRRQRTTSVA